MNLYLNNSFVKDIPSLGYWVLDEFGVNFLEDKKTIFIRDLKSILDESYSLGIPKIQRENFPVSVIPDAKDIKTLIVSEIPTLLTLNKNKKITLIASSDIQIKALGLESLEGINIVKAPYIVNLISNSEIIVSLNH